MSNSEHTGTDRPTIGEAILNTRPANVGFETVVSFKPVATPIIGTAMQSHVFEEIGRLVSEFGEAFRNISKGFFSVLGEVVERSRKADLVESSGWLPHYTTPLALIATTHNKSEASEIIAAHYREQWAAVRRMFDEQQATYNLDDEAKATFSEALAAHEAGLYRAVVRLLFPEIERVAKKEIYGGKHYEPAEAENETYLFWLSPDELKRSPPAITNLTGLRSALGKLPLHVVGSADFGVNLYQRVMDHLYKNIGTSPSRIGKYANDPVPNRHASLHGLVSYSSFQNSINMLIMADFMFHVISGMKKYIVHDTE